MRNREVSDPSTAEDGGPPPHKWGGEGRSRSSLLPTLAWGGGAAKSATEGSLAFFRLVAVICLASLQLAAAVAPHEVMGNADQDRRARSLYAEVRCVVCQNESIADSSADIAADLRADIRTRIVEGKTDTQIREALVDRYGDFILFRPRFTLGNLILWVSPFVVLILGGLAFFHLTRRPKALLSESDVDDLNAEEAARLRERLSDSPLISGGKPPSSAEGG